MTGLIRRMTRLRHALTGHPLDQVRHDIPRAWCTGCRLRLDPSTSGKLYGQRAVRVHEEKKRRGQ